MPKPVLLEEFHLSLFVKNDLSAKADQAIRRIVRGARFPVKLQLAIRDLLRRHPTLRLVRARVSR